MLASQPTVAPPHSDALISGITTSSRQKDLDTIGRCRASCTLNESRPRHRCSRITDWIGLVMRLAHDPLPLASSGSLISGITTSSRQQDLHTISRCRASCILNESRPRPRCSRVTDWTGAAYDVLASGSTLTPPLSDSPIGVITTSSTQQILNTNGRFRTGYILNESAR